MEWDPTEKRKHGRSTAILRVHCRIASGVSPELWVTNFSVSGCQVMVRTGVLQAGQRVVIRPDGIEGIPGMVRWVLETRAGIEFDQPLHQAVVEHLLKLKPSRPTVTRNLRDSFTDQFGRPAQNPAALAGSGRRGRRIV